MTAEDVQQKVHALLVVLHKLDKSNVHSPTFLIAPLATVSYSPITSAPVDKTKCDTEIHSVPTSINMQNQLEPASGAHRWGLANALLFRGVEGAVKYRWATYCVHNKVQGSAPQQTAHKTKRSIFRALQWNFG